MTERTLAGIDIRECLRAGEDASLLVDLVQALVPPAPESLPSGAGDGMAERIDSPMSEAEARRAIAMLEHQAIHIGVCWVCLVLRALWRARATGLDSRIGPCLRIAELIRAAYRNDPLRPVWDLDPDSADIILDVPGIATLSTAGLSGQPLGTAHFGGVATIHRLLEFARASLQAGFAP